MVKVMPVTVDLVAVKLVVLMEIDFGTVQSFKWCDNCTTGDK